jgi:TetR/AcrR family fatty acid metabolism transcriptional regulator
MIKSEREKNIIEAAMKVFSRKGFADTRMADIAAEAGMSYGLVYHYYQNKEKLFEAIVEDWWAGFYRELETLKKSDAATEQKLLGIIHYLLGVYEKKPDQISIFVTEISRGFVYHADEKGKGKFSRLFELCREIMEEGQKNGFLRDDIAAHYLTYVFLGSIDTFLSVMILGGEKMNASREGRISDGITKVFFQGAAKGGQ